MADDRSRSWDDALIVAYLDGELPAEEAARIEAVLREDAAAAEAARLMRSGGQAARGAYAEAMAAPLPPALAALVRPGASRFRLSFDPVRWLGLSGWRGPAFAALVAVAAFGLGLAVPHDGETGVVRTAAGPAPDTAGEAAAAALLEALETGDDGSTVTVEGRQIRIIGPVDPGFAGRCRAFRILSPAAEEGIACRGADGAWSVLTLPAATGSDR
ncbi:zf-HC2 domain-containing protein [Inquilinus sp. Marseille-Q2685]|uniref:zf-HC2 domain-containing protein n=1 Tax=Inquilinus sp. Marseille-Q2685 TaxID=2866581 RepID=UPI001CE4AEFF|nr:zf-HC2 domain-containing protein [Inquilinus sp. Marseille-Q2685]